MKILLINIRSMNPFSGQPRYINCNAYIMLGLVCHGTTSIGHIGSNLIMNVYFLNLGI